MKVTKINIVEKIAAKINQSHLKTQGIVEELLEIMKSTLATGEHIVISDFGKFMVKEKSVRKGRNPETGELMMLKKRKIVRFKLSRKLKDRINNL